MSADNDSADSEKWAPKMSAENERRKYIAVERGAAPKSAAQGRQNIIGLNPDQTLLRDWENKDEQINPKNIYQDIFIIVTPRGGSILNPLILNADFSAKICQTIAIFICMSAGNFQKNPREIIGLTKNANLYHEMWKFVEFRQLENL